MITFNKYTITLFVLVIIAAPIGVWWFQYAGGGIQDDGAVNSAEMMSTSTEEENTADMQSMDTAGDSTSTDTAGAMQDTVNEQSNPMPMPTDTTNIPKERSPDIRTAIVAGGCFWCVEADLEKLDGVKAAVSGYSGGDGENPTYGDYAEKGHREVVKATYDHNTVSYRQLLTYTIKHMDPTDGEGSFGDRGVEYSPAIYYQTQEEKEIAEKVLADISSRGVYDGELHVPVLPADEFWTAEEYHQNYYEKHPIKYRIYRTASGRDRFISQHWGDSASDLPPRTFEDSSPEGGMSVQGDMQMAEWEGFEKPTDAQLKHMLTDEQYDVTQEDGTERAFENEYWDNEEEGIYVDVVSKEPLFSSKHKYESGTGWPSFYKPLVPENVVTKEDRKLFVTRTEVRSKHGDSHLGHVFEDGPEPTGLRYCLNSAALEFVPKDEMEARGYGAYRSHFEN